MSRYDHQRRVERLEAADETRIGPPPGLKELAAEIRKSPRLRRLVAYHNLQDITDEQMAELSSAERKLLRDYRALE